MPLEVATPADRGDQTKRSTTMIPCPWKVRWITALVFATSGTAFAQTTDIPLRNWTVPPYTARPQSGFSTMTDISPGVGYVAIQPCRLVDTRVGSGFSGAYGPPAMVQNAVRAFDLNSAPHCPGIPTNVRAYSLNFTVILPPSSGDIRAWPTGNPPPIPTSIQNFAAGAILAGAAIIGAGTGGSIDVQVAGTNADILIDINGYFTDTYNTGVQFVVTTSASGQGAILATNTNTASDSAGLRGIDGTGAPVGATGFAPAGVRGESTSAYGVLGLSRFVGVRGDVLNTSGASLAEGRLGYAVSGTNYGVYSIGDIGATGTKSFVLPHPTDPSLVIRYISLEGPEAGTYFRGRGRLDGRYAVIDVPESFRFVTEPEGLSIQLTPIGAHATLWVTDLNLDQIAVQGSRDVEFFYTVNGVRRDYGGFQTIARSDDFVPESSQARLPENLPPDARWNLVTNGTYNADGSVNLETARRLRWAEIWNRIVGPPPD